MGSEARLRSEDVIINAPMSFAGAAQRSWRLRRRTHLPGPAWLSGVSMTVVAVALVIVWWAAVAVRYATFGLLLFPYRLLRRGARKRKAEALRHREMMAALERENG